MSVCYLDVQDEITDAVARLRAATDSRVIVVLPPGSRIGTSRINFRLLQREAETRGLALDVVSGEPEVRALAVSAGLRAFGNVATAENADKPVETSQPLAPAPYLPPATDPYNPARTGVPPRSRAQDATATTQTTALGAAAAVAPRTGASGTPPGATSGPASGVRRGPASQGLRQGPSAADAQWKRSETGTYAVMPRAANTGQGTEGAWTGDVGAESQSRGRSKARRRARRVLGWTIRLAIVVAIVGGLAYAAYEYVPTATISLTPGTQPYGPATFAVTADPNVAVPDDTGGKVPAERVPIPLAESATFNATGTETSLTKAQGMVTFTSTNTFIEVIIPAGTVVSTKDGVDFQTTDFSTLPKATTVPPGVSVDVAVRANTAGPGGNVDAGTITVLPDALKTQLVSVTNAGATTGGKKTQITSITKDDYDGAIAQLTQALNNDLQNALADPTNTPRGLTLYPATAALGRVTPDQAAGDLVGSKVDTFDLSADAQANVLAVDDALVANVAAKQLVASAPEGVRVFPETVTTDVGTGTVSGNTIVYQVSAQARQYTPVDAAQVEEQVRGKTLSEARSILATYGTVEVSVWPDFIPTIPNDVRRINLTIQTPEIP